jgi:hypothetical protein
MRIRPAERQEITDICREELEEVSRRIHERLAQFEQRAAGSNADHLEGVRRFYEDLTDKNWTKADEDFLSTLSDRNETEIKKMMREGFRKAQLFPLPNFAYLIHAKVDARAMAGSLDTNSDAVSAAERERLANVLQRELTEAVRDIASNLRLSNTNSEIVREQLEIAQGNIIGRLTPLV